jgi:glycosyltransferase involved in cell wall biosynthesis
MPMTPFYSIILPTFNRAHLLGRAIESVLAQTCDDWELIVIDDGSSDGTRDLIAKYVSDKVSYSFDVNGGPASARNRGIAVANGRYITFLDSDDEYLSTSA